MGDLPLLAGVFAQQMFPATTGILDLQRCCLRLASLLDLAARSFFHLFQAASDDEKCCGR
jgi:hypothetical protein